jgi:type IV pilus assembly protein PilP
MSRAAWRGAQGWVSRRPAAAAAAVGLVLGLASACDSSTGTDAAAPPPPPRRGVQGALSAAVASASASAAPVVFTQEDYTPSERNRDPFRSYAELFGETKTKTAAPGEQKQVLAERFSLDELKLVAIVTGGAGARAMFVDPEGKGWIVMLGQLIGRAETVRAKGAGGADYTLNWKADRIRENDVVFIRETPGQSNVPSATRVIALRHETDATMPIRLPRPLAVRPRRPEPPRLLAGGLAVSMGQRPDGEWRRALP